MVWYEHEKSSKSWTSLYMDGTAVKFFSHEAGICDQNYTLRVDFLDHIFYNLNHQDLSNEVSNFILSSPEVGH